MTAEGKTEEKTKVLCRLCLEEIKSGAKVCPHCERHQSHWLNLLQHLATFTALVMVLLGIAQLYEARKQRIEAESVLRQAQDVMKKTEINSSQIMNKANTVLNHALNSSKEAVSASSKALLSARSAANLATNTGLKVKSKMEQAVTHVNSSVEASNKRVRESEEKSSKNIALITANISEVKRELSSEVDTLKSRNMLTALGDKAIGRGSRKAFDELSFLSAKDGNNAIAVTSELLRVKTHYLNANRIPDPPVFYRDGVKLKNDEITTEELITILTEHPDWPVRGMAARVLGGRKEKVVPEALIQAMKSEQVLDVLHRCILSFESITEHNGDNVLMVEPLISWWGSNKDSILRRLK